MNAIRRFKRDDWPPSLRHFNRLVDAVNQFLGMLGDGLVQVKQTSRATALALDINAIGARLARRVGTFRALIGSSASAGSNKWTYAWREVAKTTDGYGGWTAVTAGRSGSTTQDPAYNRVEDMNDGSGTEGNGVDVANLDTADYTFTIQPCPSGVIVIMDEVSFRVGETDYTEYWFSHENGVDGECDE